MKKTIKLLLIATAFISVSNFKLQAYCDDGYSFPCIDGTCFKCTNRCDDIRNCINACAAHGGCMWDMNNKGMPQPITTDKLEKTGFIKVGA